MKDPLRLKELLDEKIDMAQVMLDYGVFFAYNPKSLSEAQFQCPFHGKDKKPSARFYKNTKSAWCWTCQKRWDLIGFVMEKEQAGFISAIKILIDKYNIDTSSIPETPKLEYQKADEVYHSTIIEIGILNKLKDLRKRKLLFEKYNVLCSLYLKIKYQFSLGKNVIIDAKKIENKLESLLRE